MKMIPLAYQISEDKWKKKVGTHLNLTCSKSLKQEEFKGGIQNLYQAWQLREEVRNQNFQQHQIKIGLLGKTRCYDYMLKDIVPFVQYSYMCPNINVDETEVHKYTRGKQEQGMIRSIFQNCIQVRDVAAGTRKMFNPNEWKRFRQKYNRKMLVNGYFDKEVVIENVVSSDLVKNLNQFQKRCDDVQSTRQMEPPELFRREFVRALATISGMEKHFDVKLELHDYWTSEKYLVQREPEKYHYIMEAFWKNIFDLSHCEEDFDHCIEKLSYASSIKRDKRHERLSYLNDFSLYYDEKEGHVSLIQGSKKNIKADVVIIPFNVSADSYFDKGSSSKNGLRYFQHAEGMIMSEALSSVAEVERKKSIALCIGAGINSELVNELLTSKFLSRSRCTHYKDERKITEEMEFLDYWIHFFKPLTEPNRSSFVDCIARSCEILLHVSSENVSDRDEKKVIVEAEIDHQKHAVHILTKQHRRRILYIGLWNSIICELEQRRCDNHSFLELFRKNILKGCFLENPHINILSYSKHQLDENASVQITLNHLIDVISSESRWYFSSSFSQKNLGRVCPVYIQCQFEHVECNEIEKWVAAYNMETSYSFLSQGSLDDFEIMGILLNENHYRSHAFERLQLLKHNYMTVFEGKNTQETGFHNGYMDTLITSLYTPRYAFHWCNIFEIHMNSLLENENILIHSVLLTLKKKGSIFEERRLIKYGESLQEKSDISLTFTYHDKDDLVQNRSSSFTYHDNDDSSDIKSSRNSYCVSGLGHSEKSFEKEYSSDFSWSEGDSNCMIYEEINSGFSVLCVSGMPYGVQGIEHNTKEIRQQSFSVPYLCEEISFLKEEVNLLMEKVASLTEKECGKCTCASDFNSRSDMSNTSKVNKCDQLSSPSHSKGNGNENSSSSDCAESISKICYANMGQSHQEMPEIKYSNKPGKEGRDEENYSETETCNKEEKIDSPEDPYSDQVTKTENRINISNVGHDINDLLDALTEHDSIAGNREQMEKDNPDDKNESLVSSRAMSDETLPDSDYTDVLMGVNAEDYVKTKEQISTWSSHSQSADVTVGSLLLSGETQNIYPSYTSEEIIGSFCHESMEQNELLEVRIEDSYKTEHQTRRKDEKQLNDLAEGIQSKNLTMKQQVLSESFNWGEISQEGSVMDNTSQNNPIIDKSSWKRSISITDNTTPEQTTFENISTESSEFDSTSKECTVVDDHSRDRSLVKDVSREQLLFDNTLESSVFLKVSKGLSALHNRPKESLLEVESSVINIDSQSCSVRDNMSSNSSLADKITHSVVDNMSSESSFVLTNCSKLNNTSPFEVSAVNNTSLLESSAVDNTWLPKPSAVDNTSQIGPLVMDSTSLHKPSALDNTSQIGPLVMDKASQCEPSAVDSTSLVEHLVMDKASQCEPSALDSTSLLEHSVMDKASQCEPSALDSTSLLEHSVMDSASQCEPSAVDNTPLLKHSVVDENSLLEVSAVDRMQRKKSLVDNVPLQEHSVKSSEKGGLSHESSEKEDISQENLVVENPSKHSVVDNTLLECSVEEGTITGSIFPASSLDDLQCAEKDKVELRVNLKKFYLKSEVDKCAKSKIHEQSFVHDVNIRLREISTAELVNYFFKYVWFENVTKSSTKLQKLCDDIINHYLRYLKYCYSEFQIYPAQAPRTGLDGFFQRVLQGEEMNYRQKMQYEWLRIQSFWSFPINIGMSMIYLARNGFYYTGRSTECRCYFCGHTYSDWEMSDNNSERITEIHTRISPNCVFLTGGNHDNVPIHQESPVSFAFGQVPPSGESRTTTEGSASSSSSRATSSFEAIDQSDQRQTSTSEAHPHPSPLLTIPETIDSSGQARSVSPVSGTAQSSTTTESSNQQGAPSVTASSSSELLPTSQPTTSQSGATFLVEPSPTISLPPPSGSSHTGPSEQAPLQSKSSPERDSSSSQGQNIHEKLQSSGAPTSVSSTSSQATAIVPHSVLRASGQSSGQTASGETTVTRSQSSAGGHTSDNAQSKDDRRETYDVQVVDVVTGLSNASSTTRKVVYRVTLHLSEFQYSEELNDTNHQEFLRICGQLTPIFEHLFHNVQGDQRINIIRFIPNPPVLVVFDLESYNFSDEAILRSIFSRAIQRGAISKYRISPAGFEFGLIEESNLPGEGASGLEQPAASSTTRKAATSASGQQHATETGRPRTGTSTTAPPRPQRFDPLGINFDRPRYPAYAVLTVRSATYTDWPTALTQEPLQMAVAGFFYAGYGDYVRCFFCGGGLRNWDDGDDPWEEHAKWFPRCAFVRQNKGEKFVNDVQRRHHEQGAGIEFEDEVEEQVPDEELPAFRSLLEMNYSPETIRRAIETFRQRIRPGRQIGLPMSATNLADIIFEFEEGNNDNSIGENRQDRGEQAEAARTETGTSTEAARTETGTSTEAARTGTGTSTEAARTGTGTSTEAARTETGTSTEAARTETATTPDNVVESGRMSEEERRAEQTKLLDDPSAGDISEESEDDLERMKEENISWKEKLKCKICLEKDVAVAFLPCGHLVCCTDCAPAIRICIICNDIVKGTVKTFFP